MMMKRDQEKLRYYGTLLFKNNNEELNNGAVGPVGPVGPRQKMCLGGGVGLNFSLSKLSS